MSNAGSFLTAHELSITKSEQHLLKDISLEIKAAEITLFLGHNGAGKTLLMQVLHGLILPDQGTVSSAPATRQRMVFQKPIMLRRTAAQYFDFVCPGLGPAQRHLWFDRAQLISRMHAPARRLSGGEQQKLALIGALGAKPNVLFLDEPAASLDVEATLLVEKLITDARDAGTSIVMTSHNRAQAARLADQVVFMDHGQITEQTEAKVFFSGPRSTAGRHYLKFS